MIALSNIAQGSAVLAVWWLTRKDEEQNQITVPSTISCYLGVTEPALFGVNLKYLYPFLAGMIGSNIAGLIATTYKVTSNAIGVGGLPGFLAIQPGSMAMFFVCILPRPGQKHPPRGHCGSGRAGPTHNPSHRGRTHRKGA